MGKNPGKPVRAPPPPEKTDDDIAEKPFHSAEYEQKYLNDLLNAPERPSWDEFKEQQRKKGEMESDFARVEAEQARRFRKELDEARAARLGGGASKSCARTRSEVRAAARACGRSGQSRWPTRPGGCA